MEAFRSIAVISDKIHTLLLMISMPASFIYFMNISSYLCFISSLDMFSSVVFRSNDVLLFLRKHQSILQ